MKNNYFIKILAGCIILVNSFVGYSQGFIPKEYDAVTRLKSENDISQSIRFTDLFTYPEGVTSNTDLTTIATLSVTSTNPTIIQANGVNDTYTTFACYIAKGGNVTGTATLNVSIEYNGSVYENSISIEIAHLNSVNDKATVAPEGIVIIDVMANDQPLAAINGSTIEIISPPTLGEVSLVEHEGAMKLNYASDSGTPNYSVDSFTYRVSDIDGNYSTPAEVNVNINFSPYATRVIEYKPAAGQFINKTPYGKPENAGNVTGAPDGSIISLGGFGGYIIVGFDQPIKNNPENPYGVDFTVLGNAVSTWTEPGAIMVMKDENGNGEPDDTWYELAGSEYHFAASKQVTMTYFNPKHSNAHDVIWETDLGDQGVLRKNSFHSQAYYPQPAFFDNVGANQQKYEGKKINIRVDRSNPSFVTSNSFAFGYADNKAKNNNPTVPTNPYYNDENGNSSDGFDIAWAVDEEGNYVELDEIDFIKIYNAAQEDAGWLGETSTEVESIAITTPNSEWTPQDYYVQLIGSSPYQILKGDSFTFEGLLFKNGIPEEANATWSVTDATIGSINENGVFTALETGEVTIQYSAKTDLPLATFTVDVVELVAMVISKNNTALYINEKAYVHAEGVDQRPAPANRFIYDSYTYTVSDESLAEVSDKGIVTALSEGIVTVTATSSTDPSISKSVDIMISETPAIQMTAGNDYIIFDGSTAEARIDLDTVFNTTGSGQIFNILSENSNRFLVEGTVKDYRYLDLKFAENTAGTSVITIEAIAYGDTTEFPITVKLLPKSNTLKEKQIVFLNGGQFGAQSGNVQIYSPSENTTEKLADLDANSVQDITADGKYIYVSADYNIIKYDLISKEEVARKYTQDLNPDEADGTGTEGAGLNHSITIYKDYLLATRQNSASAPEDGYNVRIYNKNDLSLVTKISVSTQAADVHVVGDSAFVALNDGFMGTSGQIAIINLVSLELEQEVDLGVDGTGIAQILNKDKNLYVLAQDKLLTYSIEDGNHELHELPIGHADYSSSPLGSAIIDDKLYTKINWGAYSGEHKGYGIVDLNDFTVEENDFIGMDTDPDITSNGYALMASAYDTLDNRFYITFGAWSGNGIGRIYNQAGAETGSFDNVEESPERMVVSYSMVNELPYIQQLISEITVLEDESVTLNFDEYFKDDGLLNYTIEMAVGGELPEWITVNEANLTASPQEGIEEATWIIKITAIDTYGEEISAEVIINTVPVDNAPEVANPLEDIFVKENSGDIVVSLEGVFTDIDSPVESMTYSLIENTNKELITTSIAGTDLTLSFANNGFGEADITIQASSEGKTAQNSFKITVEESAVTGIAARQAYFTYYPNPVVNELKLHFKGQHQSDIQLINATGKSIIQKSTGRAEELIDMNSLPTGIYILIVKNKNGEFREKIIKQ